MYLGHHKNHLPVNKGTSLSKENEVITVEHGLRLRMRDKIKEEKEANGECERMRTHCPKEALIQNLI